MQLIYLVVTYTVMLIFEYYNALKGLASLSEENNAVPTKDFTVLQTAIRRRNTVVYASSYIVGLIGLVVSFIFLSNIVSFVLGLVVSFIIRDLASKKISEFIINLIYKHKEDQLNKELAKMRESVMSSEEDASRILSKHYTGYKKDDEDNENNKQ